MSQDVPRAERRRVRYGSTLVLSVGALGVVYGDLGTGPMYAFRESFALTSGTSPTPGDVLGVLSLIIWSLIVIVSVKYGVFILRADNDGEGGILALLALVMRSHRDRREAIRAARSRYFRLLMLLGLFGAALLYGDGVITPAICVLSAVEGLATATPALAPFVVPCAFVVLLALFAVQRHGTGRVGAAFGPVMLLWFVVIAILGIRSIAARPEVLAAMNPVHGVLFFTAHGWAGMRIFGALALVITGTEAMFADIGHFGTRPIRIAWFAVVLPSLILSYLGQGALVLRQPEAVAYPFFHMVSQTWRYPLVALATAAAVIAAQGVISAAYSLALQATQLGVFPRLTIVHTSAALQGRIYVPFVNALLATACLAVVIGFRSSQALSVAFGLAVTLMMAITTLLFCDIARRRWRWPVPAVLAFAVAFLVSDVAFAAVNLLKFTSGGWLPLAIAGAVFVIMVTWRAGHRTLEHIHASRMMPVREFVAELARTQPCRTPGCALFLTERAHHASPALVRHLEHVGSIHERAVLVTVTQSHRPILWRNRVSVQSFDQGVMTAVARYGFMETPRLDDVLTELARRRVFCNPQNVTYYVEHDIVVPNGRREMWPGQKRLFALMARNAKPSWQFFGLPSDQVVEFGSEVVI